MGRNCSYNVSKIKEAAVMKRIGMLTSGGDCQALNAAMRGVVKTMVNATEEVEIYGFLDGYKGLIYGNFRMLTGADFSGNLRPYPRGLSGWPVSDFPPAWHPWQYKTRYPEAASRSVLPTA